MAKDTKKVKKEKVKKEKTKKDKSFFKDFRSELKKVVWPTPKKLLASTSIVIAMILITTVIVFALDVAFDNGYQFVVDKSQYVIEKIGNSNTEDTNATEEETESEDATDEETETETEVTVVEEDETSEDTSEDTAE